MSTPELSLLKQESKLREFFALAENLDTRAVAQYNKLIADGINTLIVIEEDLQKVDNYLKEHSIKLFLMFDRLDQYIKPHEWGKVVSPLITYWRKNWNLFDCILPKIFVRTDLMDGIRGNNTLMDKDHTISIEWSIGEVFGFFFKLVFADEATKSLCWRCAKNMGISIETIDQTKQELLNYPLNQFDTLTEEHMKPFIKMFFGERVYVKSNFSETSKTLGTPWEYFERELSCAGNNVSLRPFINTLNKNAVDKALGLSGKFVQAIIEPRIYASSEVREFATNEYFNDLARDNFSGDLDAFRDFMRSPKGKDFRFKSLEENDFEELLSQVFMSLTTHDVVRNTNDLKNMLLANGIISKKATRDGIWYRFASIYWYSWGLSNSYLEEEDRKQKAEKRRNKVLADLKKGHIYIYR